MRILVTGGAGFIGSHVVDRYVDLRHEVLVIDNLSTGCRRNVNPLADFEKIDIRSDHLNKIFREFQPDVVNHHAAQISVPISVKDPLLDADINVKGLINVLENCVAHKIRKVIFVSSGGAVYGEAEEYPTTENYPPSPMSPYAINKLLGEKYLDFYHHQYGLQYTILRYANVYGPRQIPHGEAGVVSIFINNNLAEKPSDLYVFKENPEGMKRDYIYVEDIAQVNELVLNRGEHSIFNVGTGIPTATGDLLKEISKQMEVSLKPIMGDARPGDIKRSCLNIDKVIKELGWNPRTDLKDGISSTISYLKKQ